MDGGVGDRGPPVSNVPTGLGRPAVASPPVKTSLYPQPSIIHQQRRIGALHVQANDNMMRADKDIAPIEAYSQMIKRLGIKCSIKGASLSLCHLISQY